MSSAAQTAKNKAYTARFKTTTNKKRLNNPRYPRSVGVSSAPDLFKRRGVRMSGPNNTYTSKRRSAGMNIPGKGVLALGQHFNKGLKSKAHAIAYFDASIGANQDSPIALPSSLGLSITQNFCNRATLSLASTVNTTQVYIFQFCHSEVIGFNYTSIQNPTATSIATLYPITFADMRTTPPTNMRPSRATFNIVNSTQATNVSGTCSVIQLVNNLEWEFDPLGTMAVTANFQNEITTIMNSNSRSKEFAAQEFVGQKKFSLLPSSMSKLQEWVQYEDYQAMTTAQKTAHITSSSNDYAFGTLIIRFNTPNAGNTYTMQLNAQYSMRHPSNTLLGSLGKVTPRADELRINALIDNAMAQSQQGEHNMGYYMGTG
jgi:hypothetical protein